MIGQPKPLICYRQLKMEELLEQNLLDHADNLQRQAGLLLEKLHYEDLWVAQGMKPILVGSVRSGLMAEPNVDYNILAETETPNLRACFSVVQALAEATQAFPGVNFFINIHFTEPDPYIYIGFGFKYQGEEWDFDQEIFGCNHPRVRTASQTTEALLEVMDVETRLRILSIKQERLLSRGGSWRGSSDPGSLDIYRAVFDGRARTLSECEAWIADHPGRKDYFWLPEGFSPAG